MVRSSSSCFKILACGSDSAQSDDLEAVESKGSTDKRGWSFRKRSARHRVLANTVSSDLPSTGGSKAVNEPSIADFHTQTDSSIPEKISVSQWREDDQKVSSAAVNPKASDNLLPTEKPRCNENPENIYGNIQESIAVVVQTAIRGYLARRTLYKLKNVIKLQAAVRGHLVRKHAVGTLRCVQAIVKMQALVRARRGHLSTNGLAVQENLVTDSQALNHLEKESLGTEAGNIHPSSTQKLLFNGFARQLLETTPKTKAIGIKCDPSKPNAAWQWLERWMTTSSSDISHSEKPKLDMDNEEQGHANLTNPKKETEVTSQFLDLKSDIKDTEKLLETDRATSADDFAFQASNSTPTLCEGPIAAEEDDSEELRLDDADLGSRQTYSTKNVELHQEDLGSGQKNSKQIEESTNFLSNQIQTQSNSISEFSLGSVTDKHGTDREKSKRTVKKGASEPLEIDGKKVVFSSRKTTNPAFVAVQSKFEELSCSPALGRSISSGKDVGVELTFESPPPQVDSLTEAKEFSFTEDSTSNEPAVRAGESRCETEFSVTSTTNLPDEIEVNSVEAMHENSASDKVDAEPNGFSDNKLDHVKIDDEAKKPSPTSLSYSCDHIISQGNEEVNGKTTELVTAVDPIQEGAQPLDPIQEGAQPLDPTSSDLQIQLDNVTDRPIEKLSSEGSPRSHITVPESLQSTPSSQISVNARRSKSDRSNLKRKPQTLGSRSPSNPNQDLAGRSSTEHLSKDSKNGKRRNSIDHETRISSSNSSLPNYMQVTESARAKINSHSSPRSSPDVHEKDVYIKKRHSLPATNGKQLSPRMQRSLSQAQQNAKGNGTHSPHTERKWQR